MPKPKRSDFQSKEEFLAKFSEVLGISGLKSQEARDYLAIASREKDWLNDAIELCKRDPCQRAD